MRLIPKGRPTTLRLSASVSEEVNFLGDRTEELPQSILLDRIESKPSGEVADENHFSCARYSGSWNAWLTHDHIL